MHTPSRVNACTVQYKGLQELYDKHKEAGLVILGFPCDQCECGWSSQSSPRVFEPL